MMESGSQIVNMKRNTTHIVDDIEVIHNKTLVFTTDMKCFPIEEVELSPIRLTTNERNRLKSLSPLLFEVLEHDFPQFTPPKIDTKKNIFVRIWEKLLPSF
jgi:hypothetical protein